MSLPSKAIARSTEKSFTSGVIRGGPPFASACGWFCNPLTLSAFSRLPIGHRSQRQRHSKGHRTEKQHHISPSIRRVIAGRRQFWIKGLLSRNNLSALSDTVDHRSRPITFRQARHNFGTHRHHVPVIRRAIVLVFTASVCRETEKAAWRSLRRMPWDGHRYSPRSCRHNRSRDENRSPMAARRSGVGIRCTLRGNLVGPNKNPAGTKGHPGTREGPGRLLHPSCAGCPCRFAVRLSAKLR